MIEVRLTTPNDLVAIELRDHERELLNFEVTKTIIENEYVVTLLINGKIIAIGGFVPKWEGVADVFILPSVHLPKHLKTVIQIAKHQMEWYINEVDAHRLQTFSMADPKTDKWMQALGFEWEGMLEKYTANKLNYNVWAITK